MSQVTNHVGNRIKKYRKLKCLTLDELSKKINKSKATLSKYESGSITMDIDTLVEIGQALNLDFRELIDYPSPRKTQELSFSNSFFSQSEYYMYYYDGRSNRIISSLLVITQLTTNELLEVILYHDLEDFSDTEKAKLIFSGHIYLYDTISYLILKNQINEIEWLNITILNPFAAKIPALGILSGMVSTPLFAPIAAKCYIYQNPIDNIKDLKDKLLFSKSDLKQFKSYNMMVVNRTSQIE